MAIMTIIIATGRFVLAQGAPASPVLDNPVQQRLFKTDVMSHFFAFDPLMAKYLRPLGQKLLIEC